MLEAAIFVIFPFCMAFAAISDMLSMTIANRVSLILIAAFAVVAPLTGMDWATYGWHFAAAGLVLGATFVLFAIGGMGGGDAKLLAATAVWMGFGIRARPVSGLHGLHRRRADRRDPRLPQVAAVAVYRRATCSCAISPIQTVGIPYGIALGIGGLLAYPELAADDLGVARLADLKPRFLTGPGFSWIRCGEPRARGARRPCTDAMPTQDPRRRLIPRRFSPSPRRIVGI